MRLGREGQAWRKLKAVVRARGEPCCRCAQPIDYALSYPDPRSFSVDHYPHPVSTHPHLAYDLANLHAAHLDCNWHASNGGARPGLGDSSEAW